jgi:type I restriction enzyme R subunit
LEQELIRLLCAQGYDYLSIHTEADLIANLRAKLEELNDYTFSDTEWERFFAECIANKNDGIVEKTRKIQEDYVQVLKRDDAMTKNITLIDKKNIHNNRLQVINQYVLDKEDGATYDNRYDVTVLVNGLPLVHIELKRRGVVIREAFNQINRYQRDSFWAGAGLFEYVQIFVISNGTNTKLSIPTAPGLTPSKTRHPASLKRARQATALSLPRSGRMPTTKRYPT